MAREVSQDVVPLPIFGKAPIPTFGNIDEY
jgi:hypothetical protein